MARDVHQHVAGWNEIERHDGNRQGKYEQK